MMTLPKPYLLILYLFIFFSGYSQHVNIDSQTCNDLDWLSNDVSYETLCDSIGTSDSTYTEVKKQRRLKRKYRGIAYVYSYDNKFYSRRLKTQTTNVYVYSSHEVSVKFTYYNKKQTRVNFEGENLTYLSKRFGFSLDSINSRSTLKEHFDKKGVVCDNDFIKEMIIVENYFLKFDENDQLISWFWFTDESINSLLQEK